MALRVEVLEDGTLHYISDGPVVLTGQAVGEVELPSGEMVNVSPAVIEVEDEEKAQHVAEAIAAKFGQEI